jgi:hypothetical protein
MSKNLIPEAFKLRFPFALDKAASGVEGFGFGYLEGWVTGDGRRLGAEEIVEVVVGRVDVEDVGAVDFRVFGPELDEVAGVGGTVVEVDEFVVDRVEAEAVGFGEHTEELDAGGAD